MKRTAMKRSTPLRRTPFKRRWKGRPGYRQTLAAVQTRSGGRCEFDTPACPAGWHHGEERHHVLPRSAGGGDEPGNVVWICSGAHRYVHAHPTESYERGWLRRRKTVTFPLTSRPPGAPAPARQEPKGAA